MDSSENQIAGVVFSDASDLPPTAIGVPKEHRPALYEVYGFLGWITIVVASGSLIIWAYVPEYWLHSLGIYYYPSRYSSLPMPTYVMVTIILAIGVYVGLNFMATPPPNSLKLMFDEISKELLDEDDFEQVTEPLYDIDGNKVNGMVNEDDFEQVTGPLYDIDSNKVNGTVNEDDFKQVTEPLYDIVSNKVNGMVDDLK